MRLYVAGPVTGRPGLNRKAFEAAVRRLEAAGYSALAPHWFVPPGTGWQDAMLRSVETLAKCDGVALLPDWRESRGARVERNLAAGIGMPVKTVDAWCG